VLDRTRYPSVDRSPPAADTAFQTVRSTAKLDFDVSDVFTMVANAVTLGGRSPRGQERTWAATLASPGPRQTGKRLTGQ
jgi:hypothetical protein